MLLRAFSRAFALGSSWIIAPAGAAFFLLALVYIGNIRLVASALSSGIPGSSKLLLFFYLPEDLWVQNTPLSFALAVCTGILFGVNAALFVYYIRRARLSGGSVKMPYAGIGGVVATALSVGCASCGTFLLGYVLSLAGATAALSILPLDSVGLGAIGALGLGYSLYRLAREIDRPFVC